jgi:hypothetical protein
MSKPTLEQYLSGSIDAGAIDHSIRTMKGADGVVKFYIHPAGRSGDTLDFEVRGNELSQLHTE